MLSTKVHPGIQGAGREAVPAFGLKVKPVIFQRAPLQKHSDSSRGRSVILKLPLTRLIHTQATAADVGTSTAPDAVLESSPVTALVLGASIAGLLSAAALSDYVESVIVLDKDAFVSEELPPEKLKEVLLSASVARTSCQGYHGGRTLDPLHVSMLAVTSITPLALHGRPLRIIHVQQFRCTGEEYLKRARSRKGVPQYIQLHGLLSRGEHHYPEVHCLL